MVIGSARLIKGSLNLLECILIKLSSLGVSAAFIPRTNTQVQPERCLFRALPDAVGH
jgi:hypothetical protein